MSTPNPNRHQEARDRKVRRRLAQIERARQRDVKRAARGNDKNDRRTRRAALENLVKQEKLLREEFERTLLDQVRRLALENSLKAIRAEIERLTERDTRAERGTTDVLAAAINESQSNASAEARPAPDSDAVTSQSLQQDASPTTDSVEASESSGSADVKAVPSGTITNVELPAVVPDAQGNAGQGAVTTNSEMGVADTNPDAAADTDTVTDTAASVPPAPLTDSTEDEEVSSKEVRRLRRQKRIEERHQAKDARRAAREERRQVVKQARTARLQAKEASKEERLALRQTRTAQRIEAQESIVTARNDKRAQVSAARLERKQQRTLAKAEEASTSIDESVTLLDQSTDTIMDDAPVVAAKPVRTDDPLASEPSADQTEGNPDASHSADVTIATAPSSVLEVFPDRPMQGIAAVAPAPDGTSVEDLVRREQQARADRLAAEADLLATRRQLDVERRRVDAEREIVKETEGKVLEAQARVTEIERSQVVRAARAAAEVEIRTARTDRRRAKIEAKVAGRNDEAARSELEAKIRTAEERIATLQSLIEAKDTELQVSAEGVVSLAQDALAAHATLSPDDQYSTQSAGDTEDTGVQASDEIASLGEPSVAEELVVTDAPSVTEDVANLDVAQTTTEESVFSAFRDARRERARLRTAAREQREHNQEAARATRKTAKEQADQVKRDARNNERPQQSAQLHAEETIEVENTEDTNTRASRKAEQAQARKTERAARDEERRQKEEELRAARNATQDLRQERAAAARAARHNAIVERVKEQEQARSERERVRASRPKETKDAPKPGKSPKTGNPLAGSTSPTRQGPPSVDIIKERLSSVSPAKVNAALDQELLAVEKDDLLQALVSDLPPALRASVANWLSSLSEEILVRVTLVDVQNAASILHDGLTDAAASRDLQELEVAISANQAHITFTTPEIDLDAALLVSDFDADDEISARREPRISGLLTKSGRHLRRERRIEAKTQKDTVKTERVRVRLEQRRSLTEERQRRREEKDEEKVRRAITRSQGLSLKERAQEARMSRTARRTMRAEFREREQARLRELRDIERGLKGTMKKDKGRNKNDSGARRRQARSESKALRRREKEVSRKESKLDKEEITTSRKSARSRSRADKRAEKVVKRQGASSDREAKRLEKKLGTQEAQARKDEVEAEVTRLRSGSAESKERLRSIKRLEREGARLSRIQARSRKRAEKEDVKAQRDAEKSRRREEAQQRVEERASQSRERMLERESAKITKRADRVDRLHRESAGVPTSPMLPTAGSRYDWNAEAGLLGHGVTGKDIDPADFDIPEGLPARN